MNLILVLIKSKKEIIQILEKMFFSLFSFYPAVGNEPDQLRPQAAAAAASGLPCLHLEAQEA
jgi:hypothetical protein